MRSCEGCCPIMQSTKQLARELGILRRKKLASSLSGTARNKHAHSQMFPFLIVLDFESTCWENGQHRTNEIIEFPAVLLNTCNGEIESEFHYYVLPQENPVLSDFCKQLTGITQEQVEEGIPLRLCVQKFNHWLTRLSREKGVCFSTSPGSEASNAAFVTWSDWDLGVCLLYECRRKQITRPPALNCWIDLRLTYRKFYERKPKGLNGALQDVGISFEGREHSGLHDARNTARLAWRMIQDGCVLRITKSLPASVGPRMSTASLGAQTGNSALKDRVPGRQRLQCSSFSATGHRSEKNSTSLQTSSSVALTGKEKNTPSTQASSSVPFQGKESCATVLTSSSASWHRKEKTTTTQTSSSTSRHGKENSSDVQTNSSSAGQEMEDSASVQIPELKISFASAEVACLQSAGRAPLDLAIKQQEKQQSGLQQPGVSGNQQKSFASTAEATASMGESSFSASSRMSGAEERIPQARSDPMKRKADASKPCQQPGSSERERTDWQASVLVSSFVEDCQDMATETLQEQDSGCSEEAAGVDSSLLQESNDSERSSSASQVLISSFVEGEWDSGFETSTDSSRQSHQESPLVQELVGTAQAAIGFNQGSSKLGSVPKRTYAWSSPSQDTPKFRKIQPQSPSTPARVGLQMRDLNRNLAFSTDSKEVKQHSKIPVPSRTFALASIQKENCFKTPSPIADTLGKLKSNGRHCTSTPKLTGVDRMPPSHSIHWKSTTHPSAPLPKTSFPCTKPTQKCRFTPASSRNNANSRQTKDGNGEDMTPIHAASKIRLSNCVTPTSALREPQTSTAPKKSDAAHLSPLWAPRSITSGSASARMSCSSMKRTPPLCQCGRRARRRMVQTAGPNQGRFFFSCSLGRAPCMGNNPKTGCGFFQWEK